MPPPPGVGLLLSVVKVKKRGIKGSATVLYADELGQDEDQDPAGVGFGMAWLVGWLI